MNTPRWMSLGAAAAACLALTLAGCGEPGRRDDLLVRLSPKLTMRFTRIPSLGLYAGTFEVNNRQYRVYNPDHRSGEHQGLTLDQDLQPAVQVSWTEAQAFCERLTREAGNGQWRFRLPTEREWEALASCGGTAEYPWGTAPLPPKSWNYFGLENHVVGQKLNRRDGYRVSAPVRKSGANPWGLYGIGGNVWEWCQDADPDDPESRVLKGASWADSPPLFLKISRRSSYTPDYKASGIGFRVVADPVGAPAPGP